MVDFSNRIFVSHWLMQKWSPERTAFLQYKSEGCLSFCIIMSDFFGLDELIYIWAKIWEQRANGSANKSSPLTAQRFQLIAPAAKFATIFKHPTQPDQEQSNEEDSCSQ